MSGIDSGAVWLHVQTRVARSSLATSCWGHTVLCWGSLGGQPSKSAASIQAVSHQVCPLQQSLLQSTQGGLQVLLRLAHGGVVVRHVADNRVAPDGGGQLNFVGTKIDPRVNLRQVKGCMQGVNLQYLSHKSLTSHPQCHATYLPCSVLTIYFLSLGDLSLSTALTPFHIGFTHRDWLNADYYRQPAIDRESATCLCRLEEGNPVQLRVSAHACNVSCDGIRLEDRALPNNGETENGVLKN